MIERWILWIIIWILVFFLTRYYDLYRESRRQIFRLTRKWPEEMEEE